MSELPFVNRFRRLAGEMERHIGPPEMAPGPDADDLLEAAATIERLTKERDMEDALATHFAEHYNEAMAELAKAREALKPFSEEAARLRNYPDDYPYSYPITPITVGDLRRASAAITATPERQSCQICNGTRLTIRKQPCPVCS